MVNNCSRGKDTETAKWWRKRKIAYIYLYGLLVETCTVMNHFDLIQHEWPNLFSVLEMLNSFEMERKVKQSVYIIANSQELFFNLYDLFYPKSHKVHTQQTVITALASMLNILYVNSSDTYKWLTLFYINIQCRIEHFCFRISAVFWRVCKHKMKWKLINKRAQMRPHEI